MNEPNQDELPEEAPAPAVPEPIAQSLTDELASGSEMNEPNQDELPEEAPAPASPEPIAQPLTDELASGSEEADQDAPSGEARPTAAKALARPANKSRKAKRKQEKSSRKQNRKKK